MSVSTNKKANNGKGYTFPTRINGKEVEYTKEIFFQEAEEKGSYIGAETESIWRDDATFHTAFMRIAELRGVTESVAYNWIHDIAAEMVAEYQKNSPTLHDMFEHCGPYSFAEQLSKMTFLLHNIVGSEWRLRK